MDVFRKENSKKTSAVSDFSEINRPDVKEKRERWYQETIANIPIEHLVFLDESWANTQMQRSHGRAPSHLRAYGVVPHGHYLQVTSVSAVRPSCVFANNSFVGSMTGQRFHDWVVEYLVPDLEKDDVVIMDNLRSHKDKTAIIHMDVFFGFMKNTPRSKQQYRFDTWCICIVSSSVFA